MNYKLICLVIGIGSLFMSSCDKNFVNVNTDRQSLTQANFDYKYLFTSVELITSGNSDANAYEDWRNNLIYASVMDQHLSSTFGYWGGDKYTYDAGYNSAYWEQNYGDPVKKIEDIIGNLKLDSVANNNFYQIARIFRVFQFQRITDMYGDCPYSQAGQGYLQGVTTPVYDKQQDIYMDMLNELQDATSKLDANGANTVGSNDIMFSGDLTKWKKFAFSEMLRLAMRMVKVDAASAKTWAATAVAGGVMTSTDDNAFISHAGYTSGTSTVFGTGYVLDGLDPTAARISLSFMTLLKGTNDPRLPYISTVIGDASNTDSIGDNAVAKQKGQPNGYDNNGGDYDITKAPGYPGQDNYSVVNRQTWSRYDAPTYFVTYAETSLLEAEAVFRGFISGNAADFYTAGVTAAMDLYGQIAANVNPTPAPLPSIDAGAIATYLAAHPYNAGDALNQINTQYYITAFMDEYETWCNWRRTGFPVLTPVEKYPGNVTNGTIPRRFTYSLGEATTNSANYLDAVGRMSDGDKMTSRVWWDVAQ